MLVYLPLLLLGYVMCAVFLVGAALLTFFAIVAAPAAALALYDRRWLDGFAWASLWLVSSMMLLPLWPF